MQTTFYNTNTKTYMRQLIIAVGIVVTIFMRLTMDQRTNAPLDIWKFCYQKDQKRTYILLRTLQLTATFLYFLVLQSRI